MSKTPNILIIMDGYGISQQKNGNAVINNSPNIDGLMKRYPSSTLKTSGYDVGLPDGQMGNSEVGHLNIGSGRIVYQELSRISKAIDDGDFFNNEALLSAVLSAKAKNKNLHLLGLLSDGGVHSALTHLFALLTLCKKNNFNNVYVHALMDGRDVSPTSGKEFIKQLLEEMKKQSIGRLASVCGRFYTMDRDNRWDRVEKGYNMMTLGEGEKTDDALQMMQKSYESGVTDEFILPCNIINNGKITLVEKEDSLIFFNFRPDRAREISRAFTEKEFDKFNRKTGYLGLNYVTFTNYDDSLKNLKIAFLPQTLNNTFGEYISSLGLRQLRIAETEKYAHVTFFFNGGVEAPNKNEDRILIPSPKVATYDLQPEMSALLVTDKLLEVLNNNPYDVIILNYANCDMVGHTGIIPAAERAVKTVDKCVKLIADKVLELGGLALITADHGNAEKMLDEEGKPFTAHTLSNVPFIAVCDKLIGKKLKDGRLCDIIPTLLAIMGIKAPGGMTGEILIK